MRRGSRGRGELANMTAATLPEGHSRSSAAPSRFRRALTDARSILWGRRSSRLLTLRAGAVLLFSARVNYLWDGVWRGSLSLLPNVVAGLLGLLLSVPIAILIVQELLDRRERETWELALDTHLRRLHW